MTHVHCAMLAAEAALVAGLAGKVTVRTMHEPLQKVTACLNEGLGHPFAYLLYLLINRKDQFPRWCSNCYSCSEACSPVVPGLAGRNTAPALLCEAQLSQQGHEPSEICCSIEQDAVLLPLFVEGPPTAGEYESDTGPVAFLIYPYATTNKLRPRIQPKLHRRSALLKVAVRLVSYKLNRQIVWQLSIFCPFSTALRGKGGKLRWLQQTVLLTRHPFQPVAPQLLAASDVLGLRLFIFIATRSVGGVLTRYAAICSLPEPEILDRGHVRWGSLTGCAGGGANRQQDAAPSTSGREQETLGSDDVLQPAEGPDVYGGLPDVQQHSTRITYWQLTLDARQHSAVVQSL